MGFSGGRENEILAHVHFSPLPVFWCRSQHFKIPGASLVIWRILYLVHHFGTFRNISKVHVGTFGFESACGTQCGWCDSSTNLSATANLMIYLLRSGLKWTTHAAL